MTDHQPTPENQNPFFGPFHEAPPPTPDAAGAAGAAGAVGAVGAVGASSGDRAVGGPAEITSNRPSRTRQGLVTAAVVAVAVAVVGAAGVGLAGRGGGDDTAAAATGSTSSASASASPGTGRHGDRFRGGGRFGRGKFGGGMFGGGMFAGGMGGALHGTFVVPDTDGSGYRTVTTQRGKASKVSATSITVRSDDGFEQTYVVASTTHVVATASGVTSIKAGGQVVVLAESKAGSQTALSVADLTNLGPRMGGHFGDEGGRHGDGNDSDDGDTGDGSTPSPSSSTAGTAFRA